MTNTKKIVLHNNQRWIFFGDALEIFFVGDGGGGSLNMCHDPFSFDFSRDKILVKNKNEPYPASLW